MKTTVMKPTLTFYRITAIAAVVSALLLISMAFIFFPQGLEYPGLLVLTGKLALSAADKTAYSRALRTLFVVDSIFLLGWMVSWLGVARAVRERVPLLGILSLAAGLAGALLDFGENGIIWGVFQNFQAGQALGSDWVARWHLVRGLSYWLPFIGALLAAVGLWRGGWRERVTAIVGSVLVIPAVVGMYVPGLSLLPNLWFLLWFAACAVMLWGATKD